MDGDTLVADYGEFDPSNLSESVEVADPPPYVKKMQWYFSPGQQESGHISSPDVQGSGLG